MTAMNSRVKTSIAESLHLFWKSPEKVFVGLALIFGITMVFVMPLFRVPDEAGHFFRAYQVGGGHIFSQTINGKTGGVAPETTGPLFSKPVQAFEIFPNTAVYSPIGYIPQAVGIDLARVFLPTVSAMVYVGRILNLLTYIVLIWLAIRMATERKWVYVVAALFPMSIQQAASLSSDVINIGVIFIAIAMLLRLYSQKYMVSKKQYMIMLALALAIGLTKQTNLIVLFPLVFLPRHIFVSTRQKLGFIVSVGGLAFLSAVLWFVVIQHMHYQLVYAQAAGVDQAMQIGHILHHPLGFLKVLAKTFILQGLHGDVPLADFFVVSTVGDFSWLNYQLPLTLVVAEYILLIMAFVHQEKKEIVFRALAAWSFTLTFLFSLLAIAGVLYLSWTPVGAPQVQGIQGRYFIALLPLLIPLFVLVGRWVKLSFDKPERLGVITIVVSCISLLTMVVQTINFFK